MTKNTLKTLKRRENNLKTVTCEQILHNNYANILKPIDRKQIGLETHLVLKAGPESARISTR